MIYLQRNYIRILTALFFSGCLLDIVLLDLGFHDSLTQLLVSSLVEVFLIPLLCLRSVQVGLNWKWGFTGLIPMVGFIFGAYLYFLPVANERTSDLSP
jgi:hypothetical protein